MHTDFVRNIFMSSAVSAWLWDVMFSKQVETNWC